MKRRNAEGTKPRRLVKRSKITEGIYGSTFLYLKFLLVWALVLMADFILEFRFEYLWPFWLLMRSVYDSFKYQGLAFSVFFVCIAITSDVICYLFIPVQWLFFAASTYVWVQYVWHTERGICLPTVSLWLLFVYIEASVRLREFKSLPFHLDLCRPFAAHCIGYPVVTLGFGFKSYVSYRLRLRRQVVVRKENDFYVQLLTQALPVEQQNIEKQKAALPSKSQEEVISNGIATSQSASQLASEAASTASATATSPPSSTAPAATTANSTSSKHSKVDHKASSGPPDKDLKSKHNNTPSTTIEDYHYIEQSLQKPQLANNYEEENLANEHHAKTFKQANGVAAKPAAKLSDQKNNLGSRKGKTTNTSATTPVYANNKDEVISRLESDVKRLKADLQSSRNCEQELRSQIHHLTSGEKSTRSEMYQLQQDNESLQNKLHNLVTSRQQDKQNLAILERKLQEERKQKAITDQQLLNEKKKRTEETNRANAMAQAARGECTEMCKARRKDLENDSMQFRREIMLREEQLRQMEREAETLRQYKDAQNETEVLMSALAAMQDKNTHLENSLSAETRLKMDLFSALGEAKRQIEIQQVHLNQRDADINELKSKIAEVMALMPSSSGFTTISSNTPPHFSSTFTSHVSFCEDEVLAKSTLNPNASDYTPKMNE